MRDQEAYAEYVKRHTPSSPVLKNCAAAFLVGGGICATGELLRHFFLWLGAAPDNATLYVSLLFVLVAAVLTGLGLFDRIARYAGAGTLLPITGFANAVVSPAIDTKSEGYVLGVGAKIFTVAGPVLLYGTAAATLYGFIYFFFTMLA